MESASGGSATEIVKICQADLERLASLRAAIELFLEKRELQMADLQGQLDEARNAEAAAAMRSGTQLEQLAERVCTIGKLEEQVWMPSPHHCVLAEWIFFILRALGYFATFLFRLELVIRI